MEAICKYCGGVINIAIWGGQGHWIHQETFVTYCDAEWCMNEAEPLPEGVFLPVKERPYV